MNRYFDSGDRDVDVLFELFGVHVSKDTRLLELGSGIGRMTRRLASRVGQVIATDVSGQMLVQASENLADIPNVEYLELVGDGTLPVPSTLIDVVFSYITMQHVPGRDVQAKYFSEALRVIRPGA
jgi:ubiquinone/menaquinone biosynthesis C-methylase UbiE